MLVERQVRCPANLGSGCGSSLFKRRLRRGRWKSGNNSTQNMTSGRLTLAGPGPLCLQAVSDTLCLAPQRRYLGIRVGLKATGGVASELVLFGETRFGSCIMLRSVSQPCVDLLKRTVKLDECWFLDHRIEARAFDRWSSNWKAHGLPVIVLDKRHRGHRRQGSAMHPARER